MVIAWFDHHYPDRHNPATNCSLMQVDARLADRYLADGVAGPVAMGGSESAPRSPHPLHNAPRPPPTARRLLGLPSGLYPDFLSLHREGDPGLRQQLFENIHRRHVFQ